MWRDTSRFPLAFSPAVFWFKNSFQDYDHKCASVQLFDSIYFLCLKGIGCRLDYIFIDILIIICKIIVKDVLVYNTLDVV